MAMASKQTSNYGLCQWEETDLVLHTDFNEDNQKIDTALKNLQTAVNSKASTSSMNNAVNGVAQDVEELSLACAMVASGSYTGNGGYGSSKATTLTFTNFNRTPKLVVIRPEGDEQGRGLVLVYGMTSSMCNLANQYNASFQATITSWGLNKVTWYGPGPTAQMNESGVKYRWFAVG